jgi:hypothetical protein
MATWKYWDRNGVEQEWEDEMDLPQGADFARKEFIQQFYDAILERAYLAPDDDTPIYAVRSDGTEISHADYVLEVQEGDILFGSEWVAAMQETLENIAPAYLHRGLFSYTFQELSFFPTYGSAEFYADYLLYVFNTANPATTTDSWRRKTDYDWPVFFGGRCEVGDIIGPWIFEDLRRAIIALRDVACPVGSTELIARMESPVSAMTHLAGIGKEMQFTTSADEQWYQTVGNDVGSPYLVDFDVLGSTGPGVSNAAYSNVSGQTVQIDAPRDPGGTDGVTTVSYNGGVAIPSPTSQGLFLAGYIVTRFDVVDMVSLGVTGSSGALSWSTVHYSGPTHEGACAFDYWLYAHPNFNYL